MATRHICHVTHRGYIAFISFSLFDSKYSQTCLSCHQLSDKKNVYVSVFGHLKTFITNLDLDLTSYYNEIFAPQRILWLCLWVISFSRKRNARKWSVNCEKSKLYSYFHCLCLIWITHVGRLYLKCNGLVSKALVNYACVDFTVAYMCPASFPWVLTEKWKISSASVSESLFHVC